MHTYFIYLSRCANIDSFHCIFMYLLYFSHYVGVNVDHEIPGLLKSNTKATEGREGFRRRACRPLEGRGLLTTSPEFPQGVAFSKLS